MAKQNILNNAPKAAGEYAFGPLTIPDALSLVRFDIDMTASLSGDDLAWLAEYSLDAGVSWPYATRGALAGGTPTRKDGSTIPPVLLSVEIVSLPPGVNRLVRGTLTITGATRKIPTTVELL